MQKLLLLNDLLHLNQSDLDRAKVKFNQYNGEIEPMEVYCHRRSKMTLNRRRELTHENREVTLKTKRLGGARNAKEWDNNEDKRVSWGG